MLLIRSMLPVLFLLLLHNNIYSQEKQSGTSTQTVINYKEFPITKLVFANETSRCGYYDSANNFLYDFYGQIIFKNSTTVREKILDSLCLTKDYDGDGVNDDVDKCIQERGPESNFGCPVIDQSRIHRDPLLKCIFLGSGSSRVSPASVKLLNDLVEILKDNPDYKVHLAGHTDSVGAFDLNNKLSSARVKTVKKYLVSAGLDENRISCEAYGAKYPIDTNETKNGRARNRRVEITIWN